MLQVARSSTARVEDADLLLQPISEERQVYRDSIHPSGTVGLVHNRHAVL